MSIPQSHPIKNDDRTIIVLPCFNEESRLNGERILSFLKEHPHISFLFVNDGSLDHTKDVLASLSQSPQVLVLDLEKNYGKAEAVRQGFLKSMQLQPTNIGFWDADLATPLDQIQAFIHFFNSHPDADVLFGARVKLMGRKIQRRALRHYLGRMFATVASMVLDLGIYDTQCGAKMFRNKPFLQKIFDRPFSSHWVFDVEIIFRLKQYHQENGAKTLLPLYEFPLQEWSDIPGSKVNPIYFFWSFFQLLHLFIKYH